MDNIFNLIPNLWRLKHMCPMLIMDCMLALLPEEHDREQPGFLFWTLFLRKLPGEIRSHLIALKSESMRSLAKKGDKYWSSRPMPSSVPSCLPSHTEEVKVMAVASPRHTGGLCWYHATHGKDASKCLSPCSWKAGNGRGRGK